MIGVSEKMGPPKPEGLDLLRVPDATTPVVGFRRFGIPWPAARSGNDYLEQRGHMWVPRAPTVAKCRRPGPTSCGGVPPVQACECGLYAWLSVDRAICHYEITTLLGWVVASVIGWGRVLFDEDFWRAEKAQVVAFADPKDTHSDKPSIVQERAGAWLMRVAAGYGVSILSLEELREYTLMYGEEYVEDG